jgi:ppGpp synthetase/RelA/SpoT-type nucleotidyltranferase
LKYAYEIEGGTLSKSVVEDFVSSYVREFDYYQEAARLCSDRCEGLLAAHGIKAIVSHRAKRPNKLLAKLHQRDAVKNYVSALHIRNDIPDLAGVRVALYFPGDRDRVKVLITDRFYVADQRSFPRAGKKRVGKRFDGYCADHYRVQLFESGLDDPKKQYSGAHIEIQVGSVLMHGWSEVEHDLIYKPESGTLSEDEYAILDELNGMVIASEIALERLQRAVERRLGQHNVDFASHYDLAVFLHKWLRGISAAAEPAMGRIDTLWKLLREAGLNSASKLSTFLDGNLELAEGEALADQISDLILDKNPGLYKSYAGIQTETAVNNAWDINEETPPNQQLIFGDFLSSWIVLERMFAILNSKPAAVGTHRALTFRDMPKVAQSIGLSAETLNTIMRVRITRNQLVHGIDIPSLSRLRDDTSVLKTVLDEFASHPDKLVRDAYEAARLP